MVEMEADIASLQSKLVGRKAKMGVVNEVIRGDGVGMLWLWLVGFWGSVGYRVGIMVGIAIKVRVWNRVRTGEIERDSKVAGKRKG